ncbi:MAG TPA: hypothetical protein VKT20_04465 [Candidatus Dormibacteraeota bacterium]|nr:hypothetical protein [Candidatus Dormibacteraeota bacterium]
MGASADEIDRQINTTRDQIDANLDVLETRAASGAKRAAVMIAAGLAAGLAIGGVAYLVYRRVRKPSLSGRVHAVLPDALADLPDEIRKRLPDRPFRVVITSGPDAEAKPGTWESIGRRLAPAVVSSAVSAVMASALRRRSASQKPAE